MRPAPRSPGRSDDRNDPNRGPRSMTRLAASPGRMFCIRSGADGRGECGVERIGLELDGEAGAFLRDCVRRRRRHVERQPRDRTDHFDVSADPRHTHVADENQPGRFPQLEGGPHRSGQRARDEVDRDEPGASVARRRRGQRNQPPADRREALARRQHDRLRARGDGQAAGQRVFAHRQLEEFRQVIEREHLLTTDEPGGERTPSFGGQHGVGGRCGRRLRADRPKRDEQRACS